jgi:hypothetical protein
MDIHHSKTRRELALELADYQDEFANLKNPEYPANDTPSVMATSRSSSGVCLLLCVMFSHCFSMSLNILILNTAYIVSCDCLHINLLIFLTISLSLSMIIRTKS